MLPWAPVVAWMAVIFFLSSRPVPAAVSDVPDWISHPAGYAVLALLACRALASEARGAAPASLAVRAVVVAPLFGVTDEAHQSVVPGRSAEAADLIKDLAGAVAGAGAWFASPRAFGAQRRKAA